MQKIFLCIPSAAEESLRWVLEAIPAPPPGWEYQTVIYGRALGVVSMFPHATFVELPADEASIGRIVCRGMADAIACGADVFLKLDGDGQCSPSAVARFIDAFAGGEAFVLASRYRECVRGETPPSDRLLLSSMFTLQVNQLTGWNLTDAVSGYYGCTVPVAQQLLPHLQTDGYGLGIELLLRHHANGGSVCEISHQPNYHVGNTKFGLLYHPSALSFRCDRFRIYAHVLVSTVVSLYGENAACERVQPAVVHKPHQHTAEPPLPPASYLQQTV